MSKSTAVPADVIVVGAGTAGAHAIAALERAGVAVCVIEPTGAHQFLTRLAAVAGGTQPAEDAAAPLASMFGATVVESRVVDATSQSVTLDTGEVLEAEAVILTAGAEPADAPIEGIDRVMPLRSARDALDIRSGLDDADALAIVGGGPTGCQLAGAVAVSRPDLAVTLIESNDRLMGNFGTSLSEHALDVLRSRGVDVRLDADAEKMSPQRVTLASGETIRATVVWAGGYEATMDRFGSTTDGRLEVDAFGRVVGHGRLFAAGDNAAHRDDEGELFAMSAQIAAQAGRQVAHNVIETLKGAEPARLVLHDRGWVVDLGGGVGVAELLGVPLAGAPLDRLVPLLHTAIDLRNLWQMGGLDFVHRFRPGASHSSDHRLLGEYPFSFSEEETESARP